MSVVVTVALGDRSYPVVVAPDLSGLGDAIAAAGLGPTRGSAPTEPGVAASGRRPRAVIVTDSTVGPLWAAAVEAELAGWALTVVTLPAGEAHKTVATWAYALDAVLDAGIDRRTPVVALGGGVVGDVAGFVAASALRGVPLVQVPTTLLAMVDSSVGGKVGVNHPRGKNLVGAFHQPRLVWAALSTLATLDPAERVAGLGEVVKTALIADEELFLRVERDAAALRDGDPAALAPIVARCVAIKADVVSRDEREGGWRAVLNAGHTLGHAWEQATGYGTLRHGEAVALGLVAETRFAVRKGLCEDAGLPDRLARLLDRLGLPTTPPPVPAGRLLAAIEVDKKVAGDTLVVPVAVRVGRMTLFELPANDRRELLPG